MGNTDGHDVVLMCRYRSALVCELGAYDSFWR